MGGGEFAVFLGGPTGAGKTALGVAIAREFGGEIVNADSRQLYADFPVTTAWPSAEEFAAAAHHLYGVLDIREKSAAGSWAEIARAKALEISSRGKTPIFVGGTGFYFTALFRGLSPIPEIPAHVRAEIGEVVATLGTAAAHAKLARVDPDYARVVHPHDKQRIWRALEVWAATGHSFTAWHRLAPARALFSGPLFVVDATLSELAPRLEARVDFMLARGAAEEAEKAREKCDDPRAPGWSGIGCAELLAWLAGKTDFSECRRAWIANTRAYAKRQLTWFRGQKNALWLDGGSPDVLTRVGRELRAFEKGAPEKASGFAASD